MRRLVPNRVSGARRRARARRLGAGGDAGGGGFEVHPQVPGGEAQRAEEYAVRHAPRCSLGLVPRPGSREHHVHARVRQARVVRQPRRAQHARERLAVHFAARVRHLAEEFMKRVRVVERVFFAHGDGLRDFCLGVRTLLRQTRGLQHRREARERLEIERHLVFAAGGLGEARLQRPRGERNVQVLQQTQLGERERRELEVQTAGSARVVRVELGAPHREAFVRRVLGQDGKTFFWNVFFVSRVVVSSASFFVRLERLRHGLQVARFGASSFRRLVLFGDERVVHGEVHRREVHGCQVQRAVLRERG